MFVDNTLRCLMCVLKVCRIVSINIAQVLSQEMEEKQSSLRQPVLPGSPRYYRVFCHAEVPGPVPDLQMLSGLARFNPVVAPVVSAVLPGGEHYRTRRSGTTDARMEEALTSLSPGRPFPVSRYYRARPGTTAAAFFVCNGQIFERTFLRGFLPQRFSHPLS